MDLKTYTTGIQHIGIPTNDIEKTIAFYQKLGFEIALQTVNEEADEKVVFLELETLVIETYENKAAKMESGAIDHVAINVKDIEEVYRYIEAEKMNTTKDIVKRVPHAMCIYEAAYDYIDIENIEVDENRGNANSIYFTDGKHTYHFSRSKNTLYMIFDNMELMDEFEVQIYDDPYDILSNAMRLKTGAEKIIHKQEAGGLEDKKPCLCLRLYSTKQDGTKFVAEKSGLNQWNGVRSCYKKDKETGERIKVKETPRDVNELYIPYPSIDRNRGSFFPPRDTAFELRLPDGEWISAKVCQQDGKAIMSNPNNLLGKWLLRDVLELQEGTQITYEMLKEYGIDSVIFTKLDEGKYSIDFCELGTYEKVYGLEDIDAKNDVSDE